MSEFMSEHTQALNTLQITTWEWSQNAIALAEESLRMPPDPENREEIAHTIQTYQDLMHINNLIYHMNSLQIRPEDYVVDLERPYTAFDAVSLEFARFNVILIQAISTLTEQLERLESAANDENLAAEEIRNIVGKVLDCFQSLKVSEDDTEGVPSQDDPCTVCLEKLMNETSPVIRLPCHKDHLFHQDCIMVCPQFFSFFFSSKSDQFYCGIYVLTLTFFFGSNRIGS